MVDRTRASVLELANVDLLYGVDVGKLAALIESGGIRIRRQGEKG